MWSRGLVLVSLTLLGFGGSCTLIRGPDDFRLGKAAPHEDITEVSLHALIADPDNFNGRRVRTEGFITFETRDGRLYLDRDSLSGYMFLNAVDFRLAQGLDSIPREVAYALVGGVATLDGTFVGSKAEPLCERWPDTSGTQYLDCVVLGVPTSGELRDVTFLYVEKFRDAL